MWWIEKTLIRQGFWVMNAYGWNNYSSDVRKNI